MKRSEFLISKMDCPSEEQMIRMALGKFKNTNLQFDLDHRKLIVVHSSATEQIARTLDTLNLGSKLLSDEDSNETVNSAADESNVLKILLAINFGMFVVEIVLGWIAQSTGLLADSLDMLADAAVYGLSLYAVGKANELQNRAARISGYMQLALALGLYIEVVRRFTYGSEPSSSLMMSVSAVALLANVSCLMLIAKHRHGKIHMKASWIFSTNDVLANIGVIVAGALVYFTKSPLPDFVIGTLIATIVLRGAWAILKMTKTKTA